MQYHSKTFANFWGFEMCLKNLYCECNKGSSKQVRKDQTYKNERKRETIKVGCIWRVCFSYIDYKNQNGPCHVREVHPKHSRGCNPSPDQLVQCKTAAGEYAKYQQIILHQLIHYLSTGRNTEPTFLRDMLSKVLPRRKSITSHDLFNTIVRAQMLISQLKKQGRSIEEYHFKPHAVGQLLTPIDDSTDDILDEAVTSASEIFSEYLNDPNANSKILALLEKFGNTGKGFTYNISYNQNKKFWICLDDLGNEKQF